jgi:hypothetical protein
MILILFEKGRDHAQEPVLAERWAVEADRTSPADGRTRRFAKTPRSYDFEAGKATRK